MEEKATTEQQLSNPKVKSPKKAKDLSKKAENNTDVPSKTRHKKKKSKDSEAAVDQDKSSTNNVTDTAEKKETKVSDATLDQSKSLSNEATDKKAAEKKKTKDSSAPLDQDKSSSNETADVKAVEKKRSKKRTKKKPVTTEEPVEQVKEQSNDDSGPVKEVKKETKKNQVKKKKEPKESTANLEDASQCFTIDYKSLQDALGEPFEFNNKENAIHFAPLNNAKIKFQEKSSSTQSSSTKSPRVSNKSAPSAKNKHAEIPPPASLTLASKKTKVAKSEITEKLSIENIKKEKSVKKEATQKKENEVVKKEEENATAKPLGEPVKPVVFVKEEKKHKTTISAKKTKEVTKGERKRGQKELKQSLKDVNEQDYCHPNDIIQGSRQRRMRYEPYLDPKIYEQKLAEGVFYKGVIRINKRNRSDAYVTCDNLESDIFIHGQHDRNRALEGDIVVVELLDLEKIWAKKKEAMSQKREQRHSSAVETIPLDEGEEDKGKPKYVGRVVAIPTPFSITTCSGLLSIDRYGFGQSSPQENGNGNGNSDVEDTEASEANTGSNEPPSVPKAFNNKRNVSLVWFKPTDVRKPLVAIPIKYAPADFLVNEEKYKKLLMVVKISRWPIDSHHPFGAVLRELGHIGNIPVETRAVLEDYGIIEQPFGKKALKSLPKTPWSISQSEVDSRRDLREYRIFTIDPLTAKDLDDAVHITKLGENEYEVGVHIADVSHFVQQHTALDHEAFERGTSTYLCDRVIPMLPSLLCEELCSLNPKVERLAFSVIWKMDKDGNIQDTWFGKTIIKSCAKLAYEDAQSVIEGKGLPETASISAFSVSEVEQDIMYLFNMSKSMRKRRFENGALSINSIRLSFELNELGEPCGVSIYEQKDANRLIEEFMLCANMSVAQKISSHFPNEALLRHHSLPHERALDEFVKIAESLGYDFDASSAGALQKSFELIESEDVKSVLRLLAVKPMQRAKYFCSGSVDIAKFGHYALNVPLYTHFTSPIRRFADIIVHRQLMAALNGKKFCGYKKDAVHKAASHCNERKEGAKNAQDANIQLYLSHYLHILENKTQKPVIATAVVTQVLRNCFDILIKDNGLEKRVYTDMLPIEKYEKDQVNNQITVYWKEGIEANREFDEKRRTDENYVEPSGIQINQEDLENGESIKQPENNSNELTIENWINREKKTQVFKTFSILNVRIQVNVERSPPYVNVYPVNPFM